MQTATCMYVLYVGQIVPLLPEALRMPAGIKVLGANINTRLRSQLNVIRHMFNKSMSMWLSGILIPIDGATDLSSS